jgi:hypothetical protein
MGTVTAGTEEQHMHPEREAVMFNVYSQLTNLPLVEGCKLFPFWCDKFISQDLRF